VARLASRRAALAGPILLALILGSSVPRARDARAQDQPEAALESGDARAVLDSFDAKVKAGSWPDAFGLARVLCDKHADDLLLVETSDPDSEGGAKKRPPAVLAAAGTALRRRFAALPAPGLEALVALAGEEARRHLEDGLAIPGATAALLDTGDRFFPLDEGGEALLVAGDRLLERGSPVAAFSAWRDLLALHPNVKVRARAARRLVALLPALGSRSSCLEVAGRLDAASFENAAELARAARGVADAAEAPVVDAVVDDGGALAPVSTGAAVVRQEDAFALSKLIPDRLDWRDRMVSSARVSAPILLAGNAATEDALFVHLGRAIVCYRTRSDPLRGDLPGSIAWIGGDARDVTPWLTQLLEAGLVTRYGLAVADQVIYATLAATPVETGVPRSRLVALDRRTGKLVWDAIENELEREPRLSFVGTPIAAGGRVFCACTQAASPQETLVCACDARTGHVVWKRALAASRMLAVRQNAFRVPGRAPTPSLALVSGLLLALSQNGLVAVLEAGDGRFLWARTYKPLLEPGGRGMGFSPDPDGDFARTGNPPLVLGDGLFVLPSDSSFMYVFGLADGVQRVERAREKFRHLLGVVDGRIVLSGSERIAAFRCRRFPDNLEPLWTTRFAVGDTELGRGTIAGKQAYVPTNGGISGIDLATGARFLPVSWANRAKDPGDLLVAGDRIFAVGVRFAHSYGP
jgi:hypothetical protein